jgi:Immunoglobulin I-set domain
MGPFPLCFQGLGGTLMGVGIERSSAMCASTTCRVVALAAMGLSPLYVHAQDLTRIDVEYSFDNLTWAGGTATLASPTQPIYFRVRVTHTGPTPVAGLAQAVVQPLFTRGTAGFPISLVPLPLSTADGSGVANNAGLPANLGRINPFAAEPMTDTSQSGLLSTFNDIYANEGVMRYAGANAITADEKLHWGVTISQLPPSLAGTSFNNSASAVVFKCAAAVQGTIHPILYYVDVPYSLVASSRDHSVTWFTSSTGSGLPRSFLVDPANIHPVTVWVSGNPCNAGGSGGYTRSPKPMTVLAGRRASFAPEVVDCGVTAYQWARNGVALTNGPRVQGATSKRLVIDAVTPADAGTYTVSTQFPDGVQQRSTTLTVLCPADVDNGSGTGTPDQAVDVSDLLYFLVSFEAGIAAADLDDGRGQGLQDDAVDVTDLIYFLVRFELGC